MSVRESNVTLAIDVSCARILTLDQIKKAALSPGAILEDTEVVRRRTTYATELHAARHVHFFLMIMDEYGHMGPSGGAFLAGLAERTAERRVTGRTTTESVSTIKRNLMERWQGFMAAVRVAWGNITGDDDAGEKSTSRSETWFIGSAGAPRTYEIS